MSGLATFFREHILALRSADHGSEGDESSAEVHDDHGAAAKLIRMPRYSTSLEEIMPPEIDDSTVANRRHRSSSATQQRQGTVVGWDQWKKRCKDRLTEYIDRRIIATNKGDKPRPGEHACDSGDDEGRYSLDTGVVNVRDAKHDVSYLSDVNDSTRRLISCNAVVTKALHDRFTQRASLRRTTRRNWSVDGPLALGYTRVVSLEVVQWLRGEKDELRRRAQHCMDETPKTRIMIFLYQNWACSCEKILNQKPSPSSGAPPTLLVRLENIPASCIFPHNELDWCDNDMVPYCICVGDNSPRIKYEGVPMRFDDGVRIQFQYCHGWSQYLLSVSGTGAGLFVPPSAVIALEPDATGVAFEEGKGEVAPLFGSVGRPVTPGASAEACTTAKPVASSVATTGVIQGLSTEAQAASFTSQSRRTSEMVSPVGGKNTYYTLSQLPGFLRSQNDLDDDRQVGLFAVVLGFSAARRTKRGDWMMSAALVDSSFSSDAGCPEVTTVTINMFNGDRSRLPDLRYAGDAIRIHRAQVKEFNGEVQLMGIKMTSYAVFRGDSNDDTRDDRWTISSTPRGYKPSDVDKAQFWQIWRWGQNRIFAFRTLKDEHSSRICDMLRADDTLAREGYRDFTVMVTAILSIPQDLSTGGVTPRGILRVWDGTGPPVSDPLPPILPHGLALELHSQGDPSSFCLDRLNHIITRIRRSKNDFSAAVPRTLTGRVVNVAVWEDAHWELAQLVVNVGSFIRLRNCRESILHGTNVRCLHVSSVSYLSPLPDLTFEVVELLGDHDRRLANGEPANPVSGVLPLQPHEVPAGARMDSTPTALGSVAQQSSLEDRQESVDPPSGLQRPSPKRRLTAGRRCSALRDLILAPVGSEFLGKVRVLETYPPAPTTLDPLVSSEGDDGGNSEEQLVWRFAVNVGDDSSRLVAIVSDASGEAMIGMSATSALSDGKAAMSNLRKLVGECGLLEARLRSGVCDGFKCFFIDDIYHE